MKHIIVPLALISPDAVTLFDNTIDDVVCPLPTVIKSGLKVISLSAAIISDSCPPPFAFIKVSSLSPDL